MDRGQLPRFQDELFEGENGRQPIEPGPPLGLFRVHVVDRLDPQQAKVLFAFLGRPDLSDHGIACSQAKAPDLRLGHIDVIRAGKQIAGAQEANAIGDDVQDAPTEQQPLAFGLSLQQAHRQIMLFQPAVAGDVQIASHVLQLAQRFGLKFNNIHVFLHT